MRNPAPAQWKAAERLAAHAVPSWPTLDPRARAVMVVMVEEAMHNGSMADLETMPYAEFDDAELAARCRMYRAYRHDFSWRPSAVTALALALIACLAFGAWLLAFDPYIRLIP